MSLRQILWVLVLVLLLLAGWQFLRAVWLSREPAAQAETSLVREQAAAVAVVEEDESDGFDYAPRLRPAVSAQAEEPFRATLEAQQLRRMLEGQQSLADSQRAEIEALQAEVVDLRRQLQETALGQAPQTMTSPEYSEALHLAEQGFSAEEIAARCGISVAEAGLVLSLARSGARR